MATTRAPSRSKKAQARIEEKTRQLHQQSKVVPITSLRPHPQNPNMGNTEEIQQSLREFGQYRPVVVNVRNGYIVAGHHTWLAARAEGWDEISVVEIDVDDERHLRIMVADNRLSDLRQTDETLLDQILQSIRSFEGTGYTELDVEDLHTRVAQSLQNASHGLSDVFENMPAMDIKDPLAAPKKTPREEYEAARDNNEQAAEAREQRGVQAKTKPDPKDEPELDELTAKEVELQAVLEVKELHFEFWKQSTDEYQIIQLRDDMLVEEIPEPISTWGGHEATPDDGKLHFLYNYTLGGYKGLPIDRSILSFFTHDDKFECFWDSPSWYTMRMLAKGFRTAVVPDFSFYYTWPRVVHMWSVYRAQWLGRFFQEAGMKVIPRLQFNYRDPNSLEIALRGIPRGCPVLATSQQNPENSEDERNTTIHLRNALAEIQPESVLYYSGPGGRRAMEAVGWDGKVVYLENYVGVRRGIAFGKKEGMQGVSAKQRKKALGAARNKLKEQLGGNETPDTGEEDEG